MKQFLIRLLSIVNHNLLRGGVVRLVDFLERVWLKNHMGYCGKHVYFGRPQYCLYPEKIFLYDRASVNPGATFVLSPFCNKDCGRFIMKENSTVAQNVTVINHNHTTKPVVGEIYKNQSTQHRGDIVKDIIIETDAFVGANVTICTGVVVGRGAIVGAGSVLRKSIPPYSIAYGNPATHKKFIFTPEQIIQHELALYKEEERYSIEELRAMQNRYSSQAM